MKKALTVVIAVILTFSFALTVAANLPRVNLGREISFEFFIEDKTVDDCLFIRNAGIELTQVQIDTLITDLGKNPTRGISGMNTTGLTYENITDYLTLLIGCVCKDNNYYYDMTDLEESVIELLDDPLGGISRNFIEGFLNWLEPRKMAAEGIIKVYDFTVEWLELETPYDKGFFGEDLKGGKLNILLEIPPSMRGDYDYFIVGLGGEGDLYNVGRRIIFLSVNNGNALPVINNRFIVAPFERTGTYYFAAFPKAPVLTTANALAVLRAAVGMNTLTPAQRERFGLSADDDITVACALAVLRRAVGLA
jgi:hypothetical protein